MSCYVAVSNNILPLKEIDKLIILYDIINQCILHCMREKESASSVFKKCVICAKIKRGWRPCRVKIGCTKRSGAPRLCRLQALVRHRKICVRKAVAGKRKKNIALCIVGSRNFYLCAPKRMGCRLRLRLYPLNLIRVMPS